MPLHWSKLFEQHLRAPFYSLKTEAQGSNADLWQRHDDSFKGSGCGLVQGPGTPPCEQADKANSYQDFVDVSSVDLSSPYERFTEAKVKVKRLEKELLCYTAECLHSQINFDNPKSRAELSDSLNDGIGAENSSILYGDEGSDFEINPAMFFELPDSVPDSVFPLNFDPLFSASNGEDPVEHKEYTLPSELIDSGLENAGRESSESALQLPDQNSGVELVGDQAISGETRKSSKSSLKKKKKVDWTPKLHYKFVQAVEQLGVDKAIPSKILELMDVKCLTRHNVSSHLQKYRSHKKHLQYLASAEANNWNISRSTSSSTTWSKRASRDGNPVPVQPRRSFVPIQPRLPVVHIASAVGTEPTMSLPRVPLLVWGHPSEDHTYTHMWQQQQQPLMSSPATWQAPNETLWQHPAAGLLSENQSGLFPNSAYSSHVQMTVPFGTAPSLRAEAARNEPDDSIPKHNSHLGASEMNAVIEAELQPIQQEAVVAAINDALKNRATPLPLGLTPPSMESILSELQMQGINAVRIPACS